MIDKVLSNGYCIGCGACAGVAPDAFKLALDENGLIQATPVPGASAAAIGAASMVCPFSNDAENEDQLAARFLPDTLQHHSRIGRFIHCYVGRVADENIYQKSSSGGIGRWFLGELITRGEVDCVLQVNEHRPHEGNSPLYNYSIARTYDEVIKGGKSAYYPVEMSEVIKFVMATPGKYAITGVPCFIKAVRNIARINPTFNTRIAYTIGIVCGHLKSTFYAEMLGWQLGVQPDQLKGIDFRVKIPGARANEKGVAAFSLLSDHPTPARKVQEIFGTNYGHGYFKYPACDYCDDVLAETADLSIGDAWLPEYMEHGTSIVVARDKRVVKLLEEGVTGMRLHLTPISGDHVAASQDGGLRHRREGLAYRLFLKLRDGEWAPKKRVAPDDTHLTYRQRKIHRIRMTLAQSSFTYFREAKSQTNWALFQTPMAALNASYARTYRGFLKGSLPYRGLQRLVRSLITRYRSFWPTI